MTYAEAVESWRLVGKPTVLKHRSGLPIVFVQRSWIRGRPWLRFGWDLDACTCCLMWRSPTAYPTKRAAVAGW